MRKYFVIVAVLVFQTSTYAQWTTDSTVNTTVNAYPGQQNIGNSNGDQKNLVSDGVGGVIVVWQDTRNNAAIYAQRVNSDGTLAWNSAGVPIRALAGGGNVLNPCITTDGKNGAIIVWQKNYTGVTDSLFAQRVDAGGNIKWTASGVPICQDTVTNEFPQICSDGTGGAIIAWAAHLSYNGSIYAQRIDSNGVVQWATNGVAVRHAGTLSVPMPQMCSDGAGGAFIAWDDPNITQVYVQRINGSGTSLWGSPGVALATSPYHLIFPRVCADSGGGVIVVWGQTPGFLYDYTIQVQRVNSSGSIQWTGGGVQVSSYHGDAPEIVPDGGGGVIVAWCDFRTSASIINIYTQRINSSGSAVWAANGIAVTDQGSVPFSGFSCSIASDGSGGAIIGWIDTRSGSSNRYVYAEIVSSSGSFTWPVDGITVSKTSNFGAYNQQIVAAESGNAILVWEDARGSGATNLYGQKIGSVGLLPVELVSFKSIAHCNSAELSWETATEVDNYGFEIERGDVASPQTAGSWEKIGFVPAMGSNSKPHDYSYTDVDLPPGRYEYRLKQISADGSVNYSSVAEAEIMATPSVFALGQNYPNPFNPSTTIRFSNPDRTKVTLRVFDLLGREVATLVNGELEAGQHQATFDASKFASGIYLYRLRAGDFTETKKLVLIK